MDLWNAITRPAKLALRPAELAKTMLQPALIAKTLAGAGLVDLRRPDQSVRMFDILRRWGPVAGAPFVGALRTPDRDAVLDERGAITFRGLNDETNAIARAWRERGIGEGDVVGILCRNHRWMLEAAFASAKVGATGVYMNTMFAAPQLIDVCRREGVKVLVFDEEFAAIASVAPAEHRFVAWSEPSTVLVTLEQLAASTDRAAVPPPVARGRLVLLSSGTSGTPKGAPRSKPRGVLTASAILSKVPLRVHESTMIASPLFHALGWLQATLAFALGTTMVLRRTFDPEATLALLDANRCSALVVVPVMLQRILDLGDETIEKYDTTSLRVILVSGSNLSSELGTLVMDRFGDVVYNLYGSTEVAWATIATPDDLRAAPGCAGKSPLGTTVRLYDEHDVVIHEAGSIGRIFVANGMSFEGYTGGGTKRVLDGLMATGDVGHFDDTGRLFVDGRDDEMIVSGGENVFPAEIEELLVQHDAVADAAVIGVDDAVFGQRLKAFIVPKVGVVLSEDDIKSYVRRNLASYKVPRDITFLNELPRNATGKVLKRSLV
ncbi:MAG: AMP-binding protein [Actinomycetota bacterium]|nr:AMP-binding protein [Actinomycetota bacterium]